MIRDRITLDIDSYQPMFELTAIRAYYTLERLRAVAETTVYVSTGGGIHIDASLTRSLSASERTQIRTHLNDDEKRLSLDCERGMAGHATDIFWSQKDGNDAERQEYADIWGAIDHIEKSCTDKSRVRALSKYGHKGVSATHRINRASLADGL